ncbi:hypothetical protein HFO91_32815 [Rhizobium leguminosarum]|uniref:hypothetical protein n=1 Tax=Rhizobium leguminosarum TaxID=384 RepID=UPI001C98C483|nr:hypothetical protein [Rhizobium leguminosarum]MBY5454342.1 hypothetical protein [Rhizobium leguminosarum]
MAKRLPVELIGAAIGRKHGFTQSAILDLLSTGSNADDIRLDERAISRIVSGKGRPHDRTRLQIIPVAATLLGLPREAIAREIFWRDCYDRLSEELGERGTPLMLEGFLQLLRDIPPGTDAISAWNHAMAAYMTADLSWDAMDHAMVCLGGQTRQEVRGACVIDYKNAADRFGTFASKVRAGDFGLNSISRRLIAARADSMRAAAAEQLFSLALLNEEHGWHLFIDDKGTPLTVEGATSFLPTNQQIVDFAAVVREFLPGSGWQRRISNNEAVLKLAVASADARTLVHAPDPHRSATLRAVVIDALEELRRPCDGERVDFKTLPTYRALAKAGIIPSTDPVAPTTPGSRALAMARRTAAAIAIATLAFANVEAAVSTGSEGTARSALTDQAPVDVSPMRLAGPGGTKPTVVAAIGPGGTVVLKTQV